MLNLKAIESESEEYSMNVNIFNFEKAADGSEADVCLAEGITNAASAVSGCNDRRVEVSIINGIEYPFLDPNKKYLGIFNTGNYPVDDFEKLLHNGVSPHNGRNHVFGKGEILFLSKFCPASQEYIIFSLYDDDFKFVTGPYTTHPVLHSGNKKDWPFKEMRTVVITAIDDEDAFDFKGMSYFLAEKYRLLLDTIYVGDESFKLTYLNEAVEPDMKGDYQLVELPKTIYSKELDADLTIYQYIAPEGHGCDAERGLTLYMDHLKLAYYDTTFFSKKEPQGYECSNDFSFIPCRQEYTRLSTWVDICPRNPGNPLGRLSDKTGIDLTTHDGQLVRAVINKLAGAPYRNVYIANLEKGQRKYIDAFMEADVCDTEYRYFKEVSVSSRELYGGKPGKIDAVKVKVHQGNVDKIKAFDDYNATHQKKKRYELSKEDFFYNDKIMKKAVAIYEFKKDNKDVVKAYIDQLCGYAFDICDIHGYPLSEMALKIVGHKVDARTKRYIKMRRENGYLVTHEKYIIDSNYLKQ